MFELRHRFAPVFAVAVALSLSGCGDGVVLPDEGAPAAIAIFSGDAQSGPAGAALTQALVVRVTDTQGRPVANQAVAFAVEAGGGQVAPAATSTNADGLASATWTLGPGAGTQRVQAQATGDGIPSDLVVDFTATALTGSAGSLELVSGDGQEGGVSSALADPLVVRVTDGLGNPVAGVTVTWSVDGGGSVDPATSVTGANGTTSTQRVLGPTAGTQTAQAAVEGLAGSPVTFTHTAAASNPTSLERVSGDGQSAPAGFQLPDSLVVRLLDENGNGVGGRTVTWVVPAGAGVMSPINAVTDPEGYAVTRWTLGPTVGTFTATAVFAGLRVDFSATATADVPTTIALFSGNSQTGPVGAPLPQPLRVRVTDANGNPVENVSVTWAASGGASVSSTTSGTNAQGIAEVTLTLGAAPGTYNATATVDGLAGSPVNFTAIGEVGRAARLVFTTQPTNVLVGQTLPVLTVEIQDAQGNLVVNATNRVRITSSPGGNLTGGGLRDPVGGIVTFDALVLNRADQGYTLTAGASGLTDATSNSFDVAPAQTTIAITGDGPDPSATGQSVTVSYDIDITAPAAATLTGTVEVKDGDATVCTGGIIAATGLGSCTGAMRTAGSRTLTATYSGTANLNGSTSAGEPHTVTQSSTTTQITSDNPDPSVVGQPVTINYNVSISGPGSGTPSGNVTVSDGTDSCTATATAGSCQITFTTAGARTLTATFAGSADFAGSSGTASHQVNAAATQTAITSHTPDPSEPGQSVAVVFTVTAVAPGSGTPSGNVVVTVDGEAGTCTASVADGTCSLTVAGPGSRTIRAAFEGNANFGASQGTVAHQVNADNAEPTANNDSYQVDEDGTLIVGAAQGVLANDSDDEPLTASGPTPPANGTLILNPDGSFTYEPDDDFFGTDQFTYQASDGELDDEATVTVTVNPVDDAPSFTKGGDEVISSLLGSLLGMTRLGWAQNISPGPGEPQTVSFLVSTDNDAAFIELPEVSSNGTLTYRPASRTESVAVTVTVTAQDSGGASSLPQTFSITIDA